LKPVELRLQRLMCAMKVSPSNARSRVKESLHLRYCVMMDSTGDTFGGRAETREDKARNKGKVRNLSDCGCWKKILAKISASNGFFNNEEWHIAACVICMRMPFK